MKKYQKTSGNLTHTHAEIAILLDTEHEIKYKQFIVTFQQNENLDYALS